VRSQGRPLRVTATHVNLREGVMKVNREYKYMIVEGYQGGAGGR